MPDAMRLEELPAEAAAEALSPAFRFDDIFTADYDMVGLDTVELSTELREDTRQTKCERRRRRRRR